MELYLKISYLNDFTFCPLSIYYHELYGKTSETLYYTNVQLDGKVCHEKIDERNYSTHKNILQGVSVYSNSYNIAGVIDLFDTQKGLLTERKKHIKEVYEGYVYQLYAQCLSLREMGYIVKEIRLYSYDDNKTYPIRLPEEDETMFRKFKSIIKEMQNFDIANFTQKNKNKCANCIYSNFCDRAVV